MESRARNDFLFPSLLGHAAFKSWTVDISNFLTEV